MNDIKYMRFVRAVIDPSKYDTVMSCLNSVHLEMFQDVAGLSRLRIVRVTEDRMLAASGYIDKASADAATKIVQTALAGMAEHMIEPPLIR